MFSPVFRLFLAALAIYRLACLVASEDGPLHTLKRGRLAVGRWAARRNDELSLSIAEGANCPLCLGVWLAAIALLPVLKPTALGDAVLAWLGLAGAQAWLQGRC